MYWDSRRWTAKSTSTLRERADPSSSASKINFNTSSCMAAIENVKMALLMGENRFLIEIFEVHDYFTA